MDPRAGSLSVSVTHLPHHRGPPRPHFRPAPGRRAMGGRRMGEGVKPVTRGGARQSRRGAGQPEMRGGPGELLRGTCLRGRALTLGDLASFAHQAGHGRCSPEQSARRGSLEEEAAVGHAPGPQLPPCLRRMPACS